MKKPKKCTPIAALVAGVVFASFALAQQPAQEKDTTRAAAAHRQSAVGAGQKQKIYGIIVRQDGDKLVVRDRAKTEYSVNLAEATKIQEKKMNPFRGARQYDKTSLTRGLWVEVEGHGGDAGALVADKIRFTDEQFRDASSLEARVDPVEDRVTNTEDRVTQAEQNAQRLAGQIEELSAVANMARGGARAAQETADKALAQANTANERITATDQKLTAVDERVTSVDKRLSAVDDYEARATINVNFKARSATLSKDAKAALDEIATQMKNEKGYVVQVAGFASADGGKEFNRLLSERRADAVIRYLIETHDIAQRRIITPFGYGELKPAGDNATHDGREQNRRVEVAILISKGLAASTTTSSVPQ